MFILQPGIHKGPKIVQILREGYTLPFRIRPNLTRSPTVISHYVNPHRNSYLLEALHQLMDKNAIELVHNQTSLGFFQPTFSGTQTQQQVETYTRSKQTKSFPQGGEVQNGDTGNHQDIPPARGVGNLSRLQGCLHPYTNTGTIKEISQISCPGSDLPVQGTTLWSVHSAHGVHCIGKGGEIDGYTQGYKNPPVPRRLVGQSQIPPNLSPPHPDPGQDVPGSRLAGESRKIRAGASTSVQLRRLPVRPQVRPGQTDTGPVAKPSREDSNTALTTGLSGPAVHVLDRSINSHRETGSPRPVTHETHTVASQKQLEGTRIPGKGHSFTQILAPTLAVVAKRKQCASRSTTTPYKACSANFYRRIKRRVGCSFKRVHCKGVLVSAGKQAAHKLSGTKSSPLGLKRVPKSMHKQNCPSGHRQYNSSGLHKQGRGNEVGPTVCSTVENLDLVFPASSDPKSPTYPWPTKCNSRQTIQAKSDHPNRMVPPSGHFSGLVQKMAPTSDLFATRFNNKLPLFVSPVPDTLAVAVDALTLPWEDLDAYAFPPTALLGKVVEKLQDSPCKRLILIAPGWPNMPWFWDLVIMSSQVPLSLPNQPNLLTQPFNQILHRNLTNLNLHAWLLEPQQSKSRASLRQWQQELRLLKEGLPDQSMRQSGPFLQSGASLIRWTSGHHL